MTKKLFSLCLALILAFGCLPMSAGAVEDEDWLTVPGIEGGRIQFDKETGTITDCDYTVTAAEIPNTIDGVAVTAIGGAAFEDCICLTSVTIPDSVTCIGYRAFNGCIGLTSVTIPGSITEIGSKAFRGCTDLTGVTILNGVTSIGTGAFSRCSSLTSVTIPGSITEIGSEAFCGCTNLTGVTILDGVTEIGYNAFEDCTSLTSVAIPDSVTRIGLNAFSRCSSLTSVTIPGSVTEIGNKAFCGCASLTTIEVAPGNTAYGSVDGVLFSKDKTQLFAYPVGKSGGTYEIPDGVTSIESDAFLECSSLTGITIPDSVTSIGMYAFGRCSSLIGITIPDSVTSIGGGAFRDCTSLTAITIPDGVKVIHGETFMGCKSLTGVTILGSVTKISGLTFSGCTNLNAITIPDSVKVIGESAFNYCTSLTSITIPDGVKVIGENAFTYCTSLTNATFTGNAPEIFVNLFNEGIFYGAAKDFRIYYNPQTTGWTTPTWDGSPCYPIGTEPDPTPSVLPTPNVPPVSSDDEPIIETSTTESGNVVTTTTQPNGDKELKVETPTGETIANIKLPADPGKGKEFADVKSGAWYEGAVDKATAYSLFGGTSETAFEPGANMNRGMLAQVLYNLSGKTQYGVGEGTFTDVRDGAWYQDAVDWAAKVGVTSGTGNGGFSPNQSITREQLVTMLYNYAKAVGMDTAESTSLNHFPDGEEVHDWAETAMEWAVAKGFINGREEGSKNYIAPQGTATRAEVAVILSKFVESLK